jgi:hypothetical protein
VSSLEIAVAGVNRHVDPVDERVGECHLVRRQGGSPGRGSRDRPNAARQALNAASVTQFNASAVCAFPALTVIHVAAARPHNNARVMVGVVTSVVTLSPRRAAMPANTYGVRMHAVDTHYAGCGLTGRAAALVSRQHRRAIRPAGNERNDLR